MKASAVFSILAVIAAGLTVAALPAHPMVPSLGAFATGMATLGAVFVKD